MVHCIFSATHKMREHCGLVARLPTNASSSTGTSFSLVGDGFHIETPLVHSFRRLTGGLVSFKQTFPPGTFTLLKIALAPNALAYDQTKIPHGTI